MSIPGLKEKASHCSERMATELHPGRTKSACREKFHEKESSEFVTDSWNEVFEDTDL